MPVAFFNVVHSNNSQPSLSGAFDRDWVLSGLTIGRGLLICVKWGSSGGTTADDVLSSVSTTDATGGQSQPTLIDTVYQPDIGTRGQWCYIPTLTDDSFTFRTSFTNGVNSQSTIQLTVYECTGHDTAAMIGVVAKDNTNTPAIALSGLTANSGILVAVQGGFSEPGAAANYTAVDDANANARSYSLYRNDHGSGATENVSPSQGWWAYAIEIKALGGVDLAGAALASGQAAAALTIAKTLIAAAQAAASAIANLSVSSNTVFRTTLVDYETGAPVANWTALTWVWWPTLVDMLAGTNMQGGTGESTDANGLFEVPATGALTPGLDQGIFFITDFDGSNAPTALWVAGQFDIVSL